MKTATMVGFLTLVATLPATADPVTDAHFVAGTSICINFGSDNWFVEDRIEGAGWTSRFDADYETSVYDSPDRSVVLIPPPENADFPVSCSVISQEVSLRFAEKIVEAILVKSGIDASRGMDDGCRAFRAQNGVTIRVHNDGNEVMCNKRMSAQIEVVTTSNPIGDQ